jgi:hypothetical protein
MTKRYARIASAQVQQAVNGLDAMLGTPETLEKTLFEKTLLLTTSG